MIEVNWDYNHNNACIPNFSYNINLPRHRWYEFKERFGASLVEGEIIETREYCKKEIITVVDPFLGLGTTPLAALQFVVTNSIREDTISLGFVSQNVSKLK